MPPSTLRLLFLSSSDSAAIIGEYSLTRCFPRSLPPLHAPSHVFSLPYMLLLVLSSSPTCTLRSLTTASLGHSGDRWTCWAILPDLSACLSLLLWIRTLNTDSGYGWPVLFMSCHSSPSPIVVSVIVVMSLATCHRTRVSVTCQSPSIFTRTRKPTSH